MIKAKGLDITLKVDRFIFDIAKFIKKMVEGTGNMNRVRNGNIIVCHL